MKLTLPLVALASGITQSTPEPNRVITFIAVILVLFLMEVVRQSLHRDGSMSRPRRRRR